jgi:hypothetical protein
MAEALHSDACSYQTKEFLQAFSGQPSAFSKNREMRIMEALARIRSWTKSSGFSCLADY